MVITGYTCRSQLVNYGYHISKSKTRLTSEKEIQEGPVDLGVDYKLGLLSKTGRTNFSRNRTCTFTVVGIIFLTICPVFLILNLFGLEIIRLSTNRAQTTGMDSNQTVRFILEFSVYLERNQLKVNYNRTIN